MATRPKSRKAGPGRRVVGLRVRGRIYRALLTPDLKVGGYTVRVPELPGCFSGGDTLAEVKRMTEEAIEAWLSVDERPSTRSRGTGPGFRHR